MNFLYVNGKTMVVNVDRIAYIEPKNSGYADKGGSRICFSGGQNNCIYVRDNFTDLTKKIAERCGE